MTLSATFSNILHLFSITYWCAIKRRRPDKGFKHDMDEELI